MELPFRLARRETIVGVADAYLLFGDSASALANVCADLRGAALPTVYRVRGGFLLVGLRSDHPPAGTIRLRRVGGDLFIPLDADLLPTLLRDEAVDLTRERGLIVLPGDQVLAFEPAGALSPGQWCAPSQIRRTEWYAFPGRLDRPDALTVIERPASEIIGIEILDEGAPTNSAPMAGTGGTEEVPEDARPASGSPLARFAAGMGIAAARMFVWFGRVLGFPRLARLGGNLARKALEHVPRVSEKILGQQEAALREVLRQLQVGEIEQGLRHAPIAVPDPDAPTRPATDAQLGSRDPRYSLRDLIATGRAGNGWLGGGDVWAELAREYRRLAQEAVARGDFRRAAYLYGVLLRDLRTAANTLLAGGLCRHAALLYRDRLKDPNSAAAAFERAGDYDEALRLYDKHALYELAADLHRRLGDEDQAIECFTRAADQFAKKGFWLRAGDLMRAQARRRDLAAEYYNRGWGAQTTEMVPCGERLLDDSFVEEDWQRSAGLLDEAESRMASRPHEIGRFFNYALCVGEAFLPEAARGDLADRVRLLFARHLREVGTPNAARQLALDLFGSLRPWPGPLARDATYAVHNNPPPPTFARHGPPVQLARGTVRTVAVARRTFDPVVATTEGVVCWRVAEGRVVPVSMSGVDLPNALSVDPWARLVFTLHSNTRGYLLRCFVAGPKERYKSTCEVNELYESESDARWYLQASASVREGDSMVTLAGPTGRATYVGRYLKRTEASPFAANGSATHLLIETDTDAWDWDDRFVRYKTPSENDEAHVRWLTRWTPAVPPGGSLATPPLDWVSPQQGMLVVAATDAEGNVCWSEFDIRDRTTSFTRNATGGHPDGYVAVCLLDSQVVAAVTSTNQVCWLRVAGTTLKEEATMAIEAPSRAVALVSRPDTNSIIAILADGSAVHIQRP